MSKYKTLIVGDLHVSDKYSGKHVDYAQNSIDAMSMIIDEVRNNNITHLFFLGDLVGVGDSDKWLRSREFLLFTMQWLQELNRLTDGNVYSVTGNHDMDGKLTDFNVFSTLGYIKQPSHVDLGEARFHIVNYGDEHRRIDVAVSKYNVALTHANLQVEGLTNWFRADGGIGLSTLNNFKGVNLVVGGHIHNPSPRIITTSIDGEEISIFYPGNITRPKVDNDWDKCFGVVVLSDDDMVSLEQVVFNLRPCSEIFSNTFDDMGDSEKVNLDNPIINIEELSKVLSELQMYNIGGGSDYKSQIMRVAGIDREAADVALEYLRKVEVELK